MNYASLIIAAFLLISLGYWFARGRYEYVGPRTYKPVDPAMNGDGAAPPDERYQLHTAPGETKMA